MTDTAAERLSMAFRPAVDMACSEAGRVGRIIGSGARPSRHTMRKPQRRLLAGTLGLLAAVVSGTLVAQAAGIDHVTPIPARLIRGADLGQGAAGPQAA